MSFEDYPKRTNEEKYSGMWGRISYLITRRSPKDAIDECNTKDGVWRAACQMQLRKKAMSVEDLSEIERESWCVAFGLATEYTAKKFVEAETDTQLLMDLLKHEAESDSPNKQLIGTLNQRLQELR